MGGPIFVTHHAYVNLFEPKLEKLKFYLVQSLKAFAGIIENDSLKALQVVIHTNNDFMTVRHDFKVPLKQQIWHGVNHLNLPHDRKSN